MIWEDEGRGREDGVDQGRRQEQRATGGEVQTRLSSPTGSVGGGGELHRGVGVQDAGGLGGSARDNRNIHE